jgi:hypothetical protein
MSDKTKSPDVKSPKKRSESAPQIQIRSGVRAGGAGGDCDIAYWRSELKYWRNLAEQLGCS